MKGKIVVYSWTGNTAACAVALEQALGMKAILLKEQKAREGSKGFVTGGTQASFGVKTALQDMPDISGGDVLLLGMPVWAGTTPPPINTFLKKCDLSGKTIYAFATQQAENPPERLEKKLRRLINAKGGKFVHLFVLRVPYGNRLSVEKATEHAVKWAERIRTGE